MTTAIHLKVANDRRVETERFLRAFDSSGQRGAPIALTASSISDEVAACTGSA
jgi:hypothetical protein